MRTTVIRSSLVAALAVTTALSLSAQGGPAPAPKGPAPLSTDLYHAWTPEQLATAGSLGNFGTHVMSIQRRDENAAPEIHPGFSHILMFTGKSGQPGAQGNLIIGGDIVDGPDGKKMIHGGTAHKIAPGIVYSIPFNVAHWPKPDPGNVVTYFVANINIAKP